MYVWGVRSVKTGEPQHGYGDLWMLRLILVSPGGQWMLSGCWYCQCRWIRFRGRLPDSSQWPLYHYTSFLIAVCFVFVKLLAVNKFTTWWSEMDERKFRLSKWTGKSLHYGLYRSVQLHEVLVRVLRCLFGRHQMCFGCNLSQCWIKTQW